MRICVKLVCVCANDRYLWKMTGGLPKSPAIEFSFWNRERFPLRGEHIVTFSCSFSLLEILVEWLSCCVQEDNVPILLPFMPHTKLTHFGSDLGVLHK